MITFAMENLLISLPSETQQIIFGANKTGKMVPQSNALAIVRDSNNEPINQHVKYVLLHCLMKDNFGLLPLSFRPWFSKNHCKISS